jgi:flavin reductase (DIM6/NTAB) family NADH-FMN oxidoreductase RutF
MTTLQNMPANAPEFALDARELRQCLGRFVTGVAVVTTVDVNGLLQGMTINSFSSVSLDPPLILWSLRQSSFLFETFEEAPRFAINILAADQVEVSTRFCTPAADRFAGLPFTGGAGGVPLIEGCVAHIECETEVRYAGGDHTIFIGRVQRTASYDKSPLVFNQGRYSAVSAIPD